jgi:hypothetical protein
LKQPIVSGGELSALGTAAAIPAVAVLFDLLGEKIEHRGI